ncbi:MAG: hypothetical protein JW829_14395 [Pirellulales bacterium]|nr:hypothetical protein [Pirellulales bacterium]
MAATCGLVVSLSPISTLATEWYWVNDFGGVWDEEFGGMTSWRDSGDANGIPLSGDSAFLVLPYSFSFPGFTQPVVIVYRSEDDLVLDELLIESENWLLQQLQNNIGLDQLNLRSNEEIIGGSGRTFSPPPSYPLPDPPGIFSRGMHIQRAGTNRVDFRLVLGGTVGSFGQYELAETGILQADTFEIIGDAGEGHFVQSGGVHTVTTLLLGQQEGGLGTLDLSGGTLDVGIGLIGGFGNGTIHQTGGSFSVSGMLILGYEDGSAGNYLLEGGSLVVSQLALAQAVSSEAEYTVTSGNLEVTSSLTIGARGYGRFSQSGGEVLIDTGVEPAVLSIGYGAEWSGHDISYTLSGGLLEIHGTEYVGREGPSSGNFIQSGGQHFVRRSSLGLGGDLIVGCSTEGYYEMTGGELEAVNLSIGTLGGAGYFSQYNAASRVTVETLLVGCDIASDIIGDFDGYYHLNEGELTSSYVMIGTGGRGMMNEYSGGNVTINGPIFIGYSSLGQYHQWGGTHAVEGNEVVGHADQGNYEQDGGLHTITGSLTLGNLASSSGSYSLEVGTLSVANTLIVGNAGEGSFIQSAGDHQTAVALILGAQTDGHGMYDLSGSTALSHLVVDGIETIGLQGEGSFTQRGGIHTVADQMVLGSELGSLGTYTLHSGVLNVLGIEEIGDAGEGRFEHLAGSHVVSGFLFLGNNSGDGTYQLHGGELDVHIETIGVEAFSHGRFEQDAGDHRVGSFKMASRRYSSAEYVLTDGNLEATTSAILGEHGMAVFTQSGTSRFTVNGNLNMGWLEEGEGRYTITNGELEVFGDEYLGDPGIALDPSAWGRAHFVQNGTRTEHLIHGTLLMGPNDVYYDLHSGTLEDDGVDLAAGELPLQNSEFRHEGGVHTVNGTVEIRGSRAGFGSGAVYALRGGRLVAHDIDVHAGPNSTRWLDDGELHQSGGTLIIVDSDSLHNHGVVTMSGAGVAEIEGTVYNQGLFDARETTADFNGTFFNDGIYQSESSANHFENLTVGNDGYLLAGPGDAFYIEGDFLNASLLGSHWDTSKASLIMAGSGRQKLELPGADRGDSPTGGNGNFAWSVLTVLEGAQIELSDGNTANDGTAIYVDVIDIEDPTQIDMEHNQLLCFFGSATLYYNPADPDNAYLGGLDYTFTEGGGLLKAKVPEPATCEIITILILLSLLRHQPRFIS